MKFLVILQNIVLIFILTAKICFGQLDTSSFIEDSTNQRVQSEYQITLNSNPLIHSPLFIIKQPMVFNDYSVFTLPNFNQDPTENNISMLKLRNEINQSMNTYRQGQNKYQLGVVGDILGYVSTAAAAGLAVYHVHKYKKYYGLK